MVSEIEQEVFDCLSQKQNFILDAGAGSGKTTTLIKIVNYIIENKNSLLKINQKVVCITYTNVAKDEIIERTEHNDLILVSTIHDFLWDCIKSFQNELKSKLLELIDEKLNELYDELNNTTDRAKKTKKDLESKIEKHNSAITDLEKESEKKIQYKNYTAYNKGIFSHDDLIIIAEKMFKSYPKLVNLVTRLYPFILVDEYQDTQNETVKILLEHLDKSPCVIGFLGDKMQRIYEKGIGEIPQEYNLRRICKPENYRSSVEVVNLLNKLRTDIRQTPIKETNGSVLFFYIKKVNIFNAIDFIKNNKLDEKWEVDSKDIKILYLTHSLIAQENGYEKLYGVYNKNKNVVEAINDNKNNRGLSPYTNFLFDIEEIIDFYENKKIQDLLDKISFEINSFEQRKKFVELMSKLLVLRKTESIKIEEIVEYVKENKILEIPEEKYNDDIKDNLMKIAYQEFINLYKVKQKNTPFSTQHNTKGDEFNHVLVIIDDKAWKNKYKFKEYFLKAGSNDKIDERNLFYVVCSRAKINLAIVYVADLENEDIEVLKEQLEGWFGKNFFISQ